MVATIAGAGKATTVITPVLHLTTAEMKMEKTAVPAVRDVVEEAIKQFQNLCS
jgi:hypothetical protein